MPPKKNLEADFLLIDLNIDDTKDFENCFYKFLMLKTSPKTTSSKNEDVFKFALIGSDTSNTLDYDNIKTVNDWEYYNLNNIDKISNLLKGYDNPQPANLLEAIYLAAHHLENDNAITNHAIKRIILFSDLNSEQTNNRQITENVQKFLKNSDIWLYVIGAHVKTPYLQDYEDIERWSHTIIPTDTSTPNQIANLKSVKNVLNNGIVGDFDVGLHLALFYKPELKAPTPWYAELKIGDIELKINVVKLVHDAPEFTISDETEENEVEDEESDELLIENPNTGELMDDAIEAYRIQGRIVVVSAEKEKEEIEKAEINEDKCFEIRYFIDQDILSPLYFGEESLSTVVADIRESDDWETPLEVLAEAMHNLKVAAIVKRIYASGPQFGPKPFVMFVCPEHGPVCLLLAAWPETHEISIYGAVNEGPKLAPKVDNPKLKNALDAYLSSITVHNDELDDNGRSVYCLAQHLKQNPLTIGLCEDFIRTHLEPDNDLESGKTLKPDKDIDPDVDLDSEDDSDVEITINEFEAHPCLQERSRKYWKELETLLPKKKIKNKPKQV